MASAQQKAKSDKDKGSRNSSRKNGKARKRNISLDGKKILVIDAVIKTYDSPRGPVEVVQAREVEYKGNGVQVSGRGKPSGKSYKGVSYKRILAQAEARGVSVDQVMDELDAKVQSRRQARNLFSKAERQEQHKALMSRGDRPQPRSKQTS